MTGTDMVARDMTSLLKRQDMRIQLLERRQGKRGTPVPPEPPLPYLQANLVSQAIAGSSTWTPLTNSASWNFEQVGFGTVVTDWWANGAIIPETGIYLITGSVNLAFNGNIIWLAKVNNTAASTAGAFVSSQTQGFQGWASTSFARARRFAAGDVITLAGFSTTAGPLGLEPFLTHFSITKLR